MKKRAFAVLMGVLMLAAAASAQEFWDKKDFKQWSEQECKKMLSDSPWTRTWSDAYVDPSAQTFGQRSSTGERQGEQYLRYAAQIRSALPTRMAVIRRAMIANKYDNMSPEQKAQFDQNAERYLGTDFGDTIVVVVEYETDVHSAEQALANLWQRIEPDAIPLDIYLTGSKGRRVQPLRYKADQGSGRAFQLTFPRTVEGKPLLDPEDKVLRLEFPTQRVANFQAKRVFMEFKIEKMKYKGELVF